MSKKINITDMLRSVEMPNGVWVIPPGRGKVDMYVHEEYEGSNDFMAVLRTEVRQREATREANRRLTLIDGYGEDTYPELAIIRFGKTFTPGGHVYQYAALKAAGRWYVTGGHAPVQ